MFCNFQSPWQPPKTWVQDRASQQATPQCGGFKGTDFRHSPHTSHPHLEGVDKKCYLPGTNLRHLYSFYCSSHREACSLCRVTHPKAPTTHVPPTSGRCYLFAWYHLRHLYSFYSSSHRDLIETTSSPFRDLIESFVCRVSARRHQGEAMTRSPVRAAAQQQQPTRASEPPPQLL